MLTGSGGTHTAGSLFETGKMMASFTDKDRRVWRVRFDADALDRLSKEGITRADLLRAEFWNGLAGEKTGMLLWLLLEPQARAYRLSPEDFARAMFQAGEAPINAIIAAAAALVPRHLRREAVRTYQQRIQDG